MSDIKQKTAHTQINRQTLVSLSSLCADGQSWVEHKKRSLKIGAILKTSSNSSLEKRGVRMAGGVYQTTSNPEPGSLVKKSVTQRVNACSSWLLGKFVYNPEEDSLKRKFKVLKAERCKDRLCPTCQKLKSIRLSFTAFQRITLMMEEQRQLPLRKQSKFLFMTLTVRNPEVEDLKQTIQEMQEGFRRLKRNRFFRFVVLGYVRKLEVTRNPKNRTAHPHYHVLLEVECDYSKNHPDYLTQDDLALEWQRVMRLDYKPIVDIRIVKPKSKKLAIDQVEKELDQELCETFNKDMDPEIKRIKSLEAALIEVLKYATKFDDLMLEDPEWLLTYAEQMRGVRVYSTGGTLKDLVKEEFTPEEEERIDQEMTKTMVDDEELGVYWFRYYVRRQEYAGFRVGDIPDPEEQESE